MTQTTSTILALDVGEKRIGVASANVIAQIASPLTTLQRSDHSADDIKQLLIDQHAKALVIGLPRGLDGQRTAQTQIIEDFGRELERVVAIPVYWQDEAVTSRQAEQELRSRGKPYSKDAIDALSATYILEDFMRDHPEVLA